MGSISDAVTRQRRCLGSGKCDAETGVFAPLWDLAQESADAVVFIGFGFPETDARARQMIVDALSEKERSWSSDGSRWAWAAELRQRTRAEHSSPCLP